MRQWRIARQVWANPSVRDVLWLVGYPPMASRGCAVKFTGTQDHLEEFRIPASEGGRCGPGSLLLWCRTTACDSPKSPVVGSFGCVARQSVCTAAEGEHLKSAIKLIEEGTASSNECLVFKIGEFSWSDVYMVMVADARCGHEVGHRSQRGRMIWRSMGKEKRCQSRWLLVDPHRTNLSCHFASSGVWS